jgi:hypothetical protein
MSLLLAEMWELMVALATPIAGLFPLGTFDQTKAPVLLAVVLILLSSFLFGLALDQYYTAIRSDFHVATDKGKSYEPHHLSGHPHPFCHIVLRPGSLYQKGRPNLSASLCGRDGTTASLYPRFG